MICSNDTHILIQFLNSAYLPKYLELYVLIFLQVLPAKSIDIFQTFDETTLKY